HYERTIHTYLFLHAGMRMVPMRTMLDYRKAIRIGRIWLNGLLGQPRNTIFFVGQHYTMPMQGCGFVHKVVYHDLCRVPFRKCQCGHRYLSINCDSSFGFSAIGNNGVFYIQMVFYNLSATNYLLWKHWDIFLGLLVHIHLSVAFVTLHLFRNKLHPAFGTVSRFIGEYFWMHWTGVCLLLFRLALIYIYLWVTHLLLMRRVC